MQCRAARLNIGKKAQEHGEAVKARDEAGNRLGEARELAGRWLQHLRELERRSETEPGDWRQSLAHVSSLVAQAAAAMRKSKDEFQKAEDQAATKKKEVEAAHTAYEAAVRYQRRLETLREKARREFLAEEELKEMAELAEVAAAMHQLNQSAKESLESVPAARSEADE
jgi:flagellar biosynthesis chaperone FliJ